MKKPSLILSASECPNKNYTNLFTSCGFDVTIGYLPSDLYADGLVLCGGGDIAAHRYGEEHDGCNPPDEKRDRCEFSLLAKYFAHGKPLFGICRGMQVMNVFFGGTLYRHLPTADNHYSQNGDLFHRVHNLSDTPAYALYGNTVTVNSAHHQGCKLIGENLSVMQLHEDGTPEGLFGKKILAVQWHPERMNIEISRHLVKNFFELFL